MRLSPARFLGLLGVLVFAAATLVTLSFRTTARLREQAASVAAQQRELSSLREQHTALFAQQPSTDVLEKRIGDQETLARERAALNELRAEYQRASLASMRPAPATTDTSHEPPNRSSPQTTIHSVIQSIAFGETDALAGLIDFDPAARKEADTFFTSLPPDQREEFDSPEQLVAQIMGAKTTTPVSATGDAPIFQGPDDATMLMRLQDKHRTRTATLQFHRGTDGWKLRVPAKVIEGYRARVTGWSPVAAPPSGVP